MTQAWDWDLQAVLDELQRRYLGGLNVVPGLYESVAAMFVRSSTKTLRSQRPLRTLWSIRDY